MSLITVKDSPGKGRGVFAQRNFKEGEVIETCPVIVLPAEEIDALELTQLYSYYFAWGPDQKTQLLHWATAPFITTRIPLTQGTTKTSITAL